MFIAGFFATALGGAREARIELGDEFAMVGDGVAEFGGLRVEAGAQYGHSAVGLMGEGVKDTRCVDTAGLRMRRIVREFARLGVRCEAGAA